MESTNENEYYCAIVWAVNNYAAAEKLPYDAFEVKFPGQGNRNAIPWIKITYYLPREVLGTLIYDHGMSIVLIIKEDRNYDLKFFDSIKHTGPEFKKHFAHWDKLMCAQHLEKILEWMVHFPICNGIRDHDKMEAAKLYKTVAKNQDLEEKCIYNREHIRSIDCKLTQDIALRCKDCNELFNLLCDASRRKRSRTDPSQSSLKTSNSNLTEREQVEIYKHRCKELEKKVQSMSKELNKWISGENNVQVGVKDAQEARNRILELLETDGLMEEHKAVKEMFKITLQKENHENFEHRLLGCVNAMAGISTSST